MYLPAKDLLVSKIGIQTDGDTDPSGYEIVDAIVQWFVNVFQQLRSWFVGLPELGPRFAEAFSNLGSFIAEEYRKSLEVLGNVAHAANEPLTQHPYWSLFISLLVFLGPWILLLPLFLIQTVISLVGFGAAGITAASFQSIVYGGHTPSASLFAMLQSIGMRYNVGTISNGVLLVMRVIAGVVAAYIVFGVILVEATDFVNMY